MMLRLLAIGLWVCAGCHAPSPTERSPGVFGRGVVAADHPLASAAGLDMLRRGGNAVDAAVATAFCLSVVRPYSCGIGGGGFMIIHLQEATGPRTVALDYRERAPAAVGPDHFETLPPTASRTSGHAVGVPGTVAGLLHALEHYGSLDRATVLGPAIRVARDGFALDAHAVQATAVMVRSEPGTADRGPALIDRFLDHGALPAVGHVVTLPEQALALEAIAAHGRAGFYEGPVGEAVLQAVRGAGGVMTADDLRSVRVRTRAPLSGPFGDFVVHTMPPPSSGGVALLQILGVLGHQREALVADGLDSAAGVHRFIDAAQHAFADRARWLADPEFVDLPMDTLLDPGLLRERAQRADPRRPRVMAEYGLMAPPPNDGGTSHVSVVDGAGNAVACTETINLEFGAQIAVPQYGFFLNNEMDDFLTRRGTPNAFGLTQSETNLPAPGKCPLSSMTPTVVVDRVGRVQAVAGGSGGPRIISGTAQVLLRILLFDRSAADAVGLPRVHHQWAPPTLFVEPAVDAAARRRLADLGYAIEPIEHVAHVQAIRAVPGGGWQAASDPRKGGRPAGY